MLELAIILGSVVACGIYMTTGYFLGRADGWRRAKQQCRTELERAYLERPQLFDAILEELYFAPPDAKYRLVRVLEPDEAVRHGGH